MSDRLRVLWVTNFAAPYRRPLWDHLATELRLSVALTMHQDTRDGRARGADWFALSGSRDYEVAQAAVVVPTFAGRAMSVGRRTKALLTSEYDVVVLAGWEMPIYWQLARRARKLHLRTVGFYESTADSQRFARGPIAMLRRAFFCRLHAVVVPGETAAAAVAQMGVPTDRVYIGFNAVDVQRFQDAARDSGRQVRADGHRFVYVGQLIERKNVDGLLHAFAAARRPDDRLTIVGSGPLRSSLELQSQQLGLEDSVEFTGAIPYESIPAVIAGHQTLVLPSHEEVWGLVVNEALAAGLSCVVSENAGVAASVSDMPRVSVCAPTLAGLTDALRSVADEWVSWDPNPPIGQFTPRAFAEVFLRAVLGQPAPRGR